MSAPESVVREQRLDRVIGRLRVETDPQRRKILHHLAIAEEDRFGELQAQLDKVDGWIRDGEARIERQRQLIERFETAGRHRMAAQTLLKNLVEVQGLLAAYERVLREAERRVAP